MHDLAIYAPGSAPLYAGEYRAVGGAERQMFLLARALAARGLRVCHVVHAAELPEVRDGVRLIELEPPADRARIPGGLIRRVRRALAAADARVYLQRSAGVATALVGAFARAHRRPFIYSTSSDLDLLYRIPQAWSETVGFRLGLRLAGTVVVQTRAQAAAAASDPRIVHIPSLCEPVHRRSPTPPRDLFLWVGRAASYKNPLAFVELARAVPEAHFVMVGVDQLAVMQLAGRSRSFESKLPPNLELLGPLSPAQLGALYARAVAVVNTSQFEGFPNALLEGWAHGALALSLRIDPDGVIARHGLGVVANGSHAVLAAAAATMWRARAAQEAERAAALRYVIASHAPEVVAARWAALLGDVLGRA